MEVLLPLTLIATIILLGFIGELIFKKTNIASVIWLLLFGLLLGPVFNVVPSGVFMSVSSFVAAFAIIMILFDSGIYMDLDKLFREAPRGVFLAVISFVLSVLVVGTAGYFLGYGILKSLLLGAIIGGTSSPIVIPIVSKMKNMKESIRLVLSIESAITDVLCIVVAIVLMQALQTGMVSNAAHLIASAFSIGIVAGLFVGLLWIPIMRRLAKVSFSYVVSLAVLFLLYSATEVLKGSGAIACLVFGVVLANGKKILEIMRHKSHAYEMDAQTKDFHSLITFLIRTFFFVYLGMLVSVKSIEFVYVGILLSALILLVRPLAVRISDYHKDTPPGEKRLMGVLIPRGLAAAVLAYLPTANGIAGTEGFVDIVFTVILSTVVICTIGIYFFGNHAENKKAIVKEVRKAAKEESYEAP